MDRNLQTEFSNYLNNLRVPTSDSDVINSARLEIKAALREGLKIGQRGEKIYSPRFMPQGSHVYRTQNDPCSNPPQQVDFDYGCYMPFSYHDGSPQEAATDFFERVDTILNKLANAKKWQGISKDKKTCSRVLINNKIHIDVPLYSIPDDQMFTIVEAAQRTDGNILSKHRSANWQEDAADDVTWDEIPHERVLLAHRTESWKPSDPRKLNVYFTAQLDTYPGLRRVCRYLKGWRDFKWNQGGGPSSIYLMCLADSIYPRGSSQADDEALKFIAERIPERVQSPVINPAETEREVISISPDDARDLSAFANALSSAITRAKNPTLCTGDEACSILQRHFGSRFPGERLDSQDETRVIESVPSTRNTSTPPKSYRSA